MMKLRTATVVAISMATIVLSAKAQQTITILTEPFTYPDGPLVGTAGSPWTTNSGTAGQQNVVGGRLFLDDDETEDTIGPIRSSGQGGASSGILIATFTLQVDPLDVPTSAAGDYIMHFVASNNAFIGRVFTLTDPAGTGTTFRMGLSTSAVTPNAIFTGVFTTGTTYSITLAYDFATNRAALSAVGFGTVNSTDVLDNNFINRIGFRQTANTGDQFIDNLVITIPEPATYILMGFGALLCAQQFRRRKS